MVAIIFALAVIMFLGGMSIGAYLVTQGHPFFALLVFIITAIVVGGVSYRKTD